MNTLSLETTPRRSYTDDAHAQILHYGRSLAHLSMEELNALGTSCLIRQVEVGRPVLELLAEAVRLEINRRIMFSLESRGR